MTLWLDEDLINQWKASPANKIGHPCLYSDAAIYFCYTIKSLFSLALRQCQGFVSSIFELSKIELPVPHYSWVCRRVKSMNLPKISDQTSACHVAIDASGIKIYGEGEWKMRTHGKEKRRTWRKIHISLDAENKEILACVTSNANVHDSEKASEVLSPLNKADRVYGDGAYDNQKSYEAASKIGAFGVFPPRQGACLSELPYEGAPENVRDTHILGIELLGSREWKIMMKYGFRSLSENVFFRFKKIFGEKLQARCEMNQAFEVATKMKILNQFRAIGMPISFPLN